MVVDCIRPWFSRERTWRRLEWSVSAVSSRHEKAPSPPRPRIYFVESVQRPLRAAGWFPYSISERDVRSFSPKTKSVSLRRVPSGPRRPLTNVLQTLDPCSCRHPSDKSYLTATFRSHDSARSARLPVLSLRLGTSRNEDAQYLFRKYPRSGCCNGMIDLRDRHESGSSFSRWGLSSF